MTPAMLPSASYCMSPYSTAAGGPAILRTPAMRVAGQVAHLGRLIADRSASDLAQVTPFRSVPVRSCPERSFSVVPLPSSQRQ